MEKPWCNNAGAVDYHPNNLPPSFRQPSVDGLGGRGLRRINPNDSEIAGKAFQYFRIERRRRTVVDDNYLVIFGTNVTLIGRRKRMQGPRRFAWDVINNDHDRKLQTSVPGGGKVGHFFVGFHRSTMRLPRERGNASLGRKQVAVMNYIETGPGRREKPRNVSCVCSYL
jgi:hypothetical protein